MITPVFLISDLLIYLLLVLFIGTAYVSRKNLILRNSWAKVCQHPSRIVAMLVLMLFVGIGLLDSIHFMPQQAEANTKVRSVLDLLLEPISSAVESSYSAPFATHLFVKTMRKDQQGQIVWIAEPLQHVQAKPILDLIMQGLYISLILIIGMSIFFLLYKVRDKQTKQIFNRNTVTAWITLAVLIMIVAICARLCKFYHIFGTDKIGVDVFYFAIKSIRTGLIIGILTTMLTLPFAIFFGALAGYYLGWVDDVIQYVYTTLSSIPGVLLIAAAMLSLDAFLMRHSDVFNSGYQLADARLILLCAILGITSWTSLCRILRGETLKVREQNFILAARAVGLSSMQIIRRHVIPNLMHIILMAIILDFSGLVLAEAVLSYVGVGVDSTMFSWGNMINGARMEMGRDPVIWWSLTGAFIMMFTLVLAANIFADGVRDAFDPRA